jgi:uncharacterized damage-inducible protein DinB
MAGTSFGRLFLQITRHCCHAAIVFRRIYLIGISESHYACRNLSASTEETIGDRSARCQAYQQKENEERTVTEQTLPLITFYKGWAGYNKNLIKIIAPLSPEHLALPVSPQHWTLGMVAQHIVANRVWWFQVWMGEGNPDLAPIAHWDPADDVEQSPLNAAELVAGLEATWQMIAGALSRWTPADLDQIFQPPAALKEEERHLFSPYSRQWIIWHVLEHEIHHGGELSLALGTLGLTTIYDL